LNEQNEQLINEKNQLVQQMETIEQTLNENEQLKEKITQVKKIFFNLINIRFLFI